MSFDERVVLNVGGSRFEVSLRTLSRHPESLLDNLFGPNSSSEIQKDAGGNLVPPADLTPQQILKELEFWQLDASEYLKSLENESAIRGYVEPPVETPLNQLDHDDIQAHLASLPAPERLQIITEFVHHSDHDLIILATKVLESLLQDLEVDPATQGHSLHREALALISLGYYRIGKINLARKHLNDLLKYEPESKQGKALQVLVTDTSTNYAKMGVFAIGLALFGLASFKVLQWTSAASLSKKTSQR